MSSDLYEEGTMPSYNGNIPIKPSNMEFTYEFDGWTPTITSVTSDVEYIATFKEIKNKYTYTFYDEDGVTPLKEDTIYYGEIIVPPINPSKSSDSQNTYVFDGWYIAKVGGTKVEEFDAISNNISYYARYKNITNKYIVTWKNWDGEVLETDTNVEYGTMPSYNGNTPVKSSDQNNQYVFEKWDKEITSVTGDVEYIATFKAIPHSYCLVQFDSKGGTEVVSQNVLKGEKATKPKNPTKEGYIFDDWYYQGEKWSFIGYVVTENMTLEARWNVNSYTLNLSRNNTNAGTISNNSGLHNYNESITVTAITNPGYTFIGWYDGDNEITKETSYTFNMPNNNVSYTAKWSVNNDTQYKVEHYLQNLDDNKYAIDATDTLYGVTNSYTLAITKDYTGFDKPNVQQQIINGNGTTVIKLYYVRKTYTVSAINNINVGKITGTGTYKYGKDIKIQITPYLGYQLDEFNINNEFVTKELSYTIQNISENIEFELKWSVLPELENFEFTSTIDSLKIRNVVDKSLSSIVIPNCVTSIDNGVFSKCEALQNIYYDGTIENWCCIKFGNVLSNPMYYAINFYILDESGNIQYNENNYSLLTEFEIPDSITMINNYAFYNFKQLSSIKISNSVTSIGTSAFYNCSSLISIIMSNSLTCIENNAFYACKSLTNVNVPNSVSYIGDYAFEYCKSLKTIKMPSNLLSIKKDAFYYCDSLIEIYFDGMIENWCNIEFDGSSSNPMCYATKFYIAEENGDVEYDGRKYLLLTELIIPDSVTTINNYSFFKFEQLTSITIPNSITSMGDTAFGGCKSLTSIKIPKDVTFIGSGTFVNCNSLKNVYYDGTIEEWCNIKINAISSSMCYSNPMCYANNFYILDEKGDIEYTGNKYSLLTELVIPNTVVSIMDYQFYGFNCITNIEMPNSVTSIGQYAFYNCWRITNIEIPNSVTSIGYSAFAGCSSLTSIEIPNSVTSIGSYVLSGCRSLKLISIPFVGDKEHTSTDTYQYPFGYIFGQKSYDGGISTIQHSYEYNSSKIISSIYYIPSTLKEVIITGSSYIPYGAFYNCSSLTNIVIPASVTSIGNNAFYEFKSLKTVYYGGTIEDWWNIEINSNPMIFATNFYFSDKNGDIEYAGNRYSLLTELVIPNTVVSITENQFYGFNCITNIVIPNSVTSIGSNAFYNCSSLENVYYDGTIEDWCSITFNYSEANPMNNAKNFYILDSTGNIEHNGNNYSLLTELKIPNSVTSIGKGAFSGCSSLVSIEIPDSVTSIGQSAFYNCSSLENVYYDGTIEDWCNISFYHSYSNPLIGAKNFYILDENGDVEYNGKFYSLLTELKIPNSVTSIGNYAFYECTSLVSIEIPDSVTSIGGSAFYNCSSLTSIEIPNSVTSIGNYAFAGCSSLTSIEIPSSVTSIGNDVFYNCNSITFVNIPSNLINKIPKDKITDLIINSGDIGSNAFLDSKTLLNVEIKSGVNCIGYRAFCGCRVLKTIVIPNSITYMDEKAFKDSFATVYYDGTIEDWCNISFYHSYSNPLIGAKNFYILDENGDVEYNGKFYSLLTELKIPNSVTSIGNYAFYECTSLASIIIPNSVTSIGNYAFYECTSLASVYYKGTEEEWNKMTINDNSYLTNAKRYYYSEEKPTTEGNYWHYVYNEIVIWE